MAVTETPGTRVFVPQSQSIQTLTASTATAVQNINVTQYITTISGSTVTVGTHNMYLLPEGPDGCEKLVYQLATGVCSVKLTMSTGLHYIGRDKADVASATGIAGAVVGAATGHLILSAKNSWFRAVFIDAGWTILGGSATFGTGTG